MSDYIVHKAVELSKVTSKRRALLSEPDFLEQCFIAQAKYDGCNMIVDIRPEGAAVPFHVLSRTGEQVLSCDHIAEALMGLKKPGVYLGECWHPDMAFPEISGAFRRHSPSPDLKMVVFDFLRHDEFQNGHSDARYLDRAERLGLLANSTVKQPVFLAQSFGHLADQGWTAQDTANKLVAVGGYDGLILRDPLGTWTIGSGTNGEILKVKPKLSFDLQVVDYNLGKGKHSDRIGTLMVEFRGKLQGAGTGLKDSERAVEDFKDNWLGKIVEIECLGVTEDGQLREPRMKGLRHDKTEPDE